MKGTIAMEKNNQEIIMQNSIILWIAVATGILLLIPLIAMQLTDEVAWSLKDFVEMGVTLFSLSSLFVLSARRVQNRYRVLVGILFLAVFMWLWAELSVGVFTIWGN